MAFHFKKTESPTQAVRRVCAECIETALEHLQQPHRPSAVHGVRKEIKKLRAIFRLVRSDMGRGTYRKSSKALREAADHLGTPRDALVMLKAFDKLVGRPATRFGRIRMELQTHSRTAANEFQAGDSLARAKKLLFKARRRIHRLKLKKSGWAALAPGLKESYRDGRAACALARREPDAENLHEWRKQVKHLWYDFLLLNPARRAAPRPTAQGLKLLGSQLGDEHDLFILQQHVTAHCGPLAKEQAALNRLIVARRKKLCSAALQLGSRLYAEAPKVVCQRMGKCWEEWHGAGRRK